MAQQKKTTKSAEKEKFVNGIWLVAQSTFWNNKQFSVLEQENLKQLISDHYTNRQAYAITFKELCERICLAKRYVDRKQGRYISKPLDWLNIHYLKGLSATANWLEEVKEQRKTVPQYNEGISTFSYAVLNYIDFPNIRVFDHYRKALLQQEQYDLLQIFYNLIVNHQYQK